MQIAEPIDPKKELEVEFFTDPAADRHSTGLIIGPLPCRNLER